MPTCTLGNYAIQQIWYKRLTGGRDRSLGVRTWGRDRGRQTGRQREGAEKEKREKTEQRAEKGARGHRERSGVAGDPFIHSPHLVHLAGSR